MWFDDDDDDDEKTEEVPESCGETGDYNLGDDIGTRIGEGHDSAAEPT